MEKENEEPKTTFAELQPTQTTLLNNLPGMAYRCLHDSRRTTLFASQGCLELIGYQPMELVNSFAISFAELICEEDQTAVYEGIEAAIAKKRPYCCNYRIITASGTERWVLDKGEAVFTPDGTVAVLEGFVTDDTERMMAFQRLEQRVADRTRQLSALYDILEVASAPTDLQTTINRSLRRVLKAIKGDVGAIHLLDKTDNTLRLAAQHGLIDATAARLAQINIKENRMAAWVVRHNTPLIIPNISEDPRTVNWAFNHDLDICVAVPIVANNQVSGVLTVLGDDLSRYSAKEEIDLLISVGEQLGVVAENARLRQQAEQLIVFEERNRLSRELHDSVTQSLYSVTLFAEAGLNLTRAGEHKRAGHFFKDVLETGQQALKEMRLLVHKLRPSVLDKEGLIRAIRHRLNAVEGRAGVKTQFVTKITSMEINHDVEEALYFVMQEALNNAIKHANASEVQVFLVEAEDEQLSLRVKDNGSGFDVELAAEGSGLGLISMQERITQHSGTISFHSSIGQGTEIRVHVPFKQKGQPVDNK